MARQNHGNNNAAAFAAYARAHGLDPKTWLPVPPPAAPKPVNGYNTGADLMDINNFLTQYATSMEDVDNQLAGLSTDTKFQKSENNKTAKENTGGTADAMAARGLFASSVKDAALYDIEATRTLSNKFLDDKLTQATLQAGTRKQTLLESKKRFDEANLARQGENASAINDPANAAWADQMATFNAAKKPLAPATPAPRIAPAAASPRAPVAVASHPQPAGPAFTTSPGVNSRGEHGTWHIYPDGHKIFVKS